MITPPTSLTTEEPWLHPSIPETLSSSLDSVYEGDVRLVSIQVRRRPLLSTYVSTKHHIFNRWIDTIDRYQ